MRAGMNIRKIAVIGAGTMGGGIAQVAAQAGFEVIVRDINDETVLKGMGRVRDRLENRVREGKLDATVKESILALIRPVTRLEDCRDAELVIEAVIEDAETKRGLFRELDTLCLPETLFASNTSSIPITELARATGRPERFAGMHFMNPAYVMKLVEVIRGLLTAEETISRIEGVVEQMGKTPVVVNDSPGFVISRVIITMINDAIYCLEEGVASREGIDTIMKLGAHHPMGPLELADLMGLDVCLEILDILRSDLGEKYRASPLLRKMVAAGRLGRKSGEGFYGYR